MLESVVYPKPWLLFWAAGALSLGYLVVVLALRWRLWARGLSLPAPPPHPRGKVAGIWFVEVFAQPQLLRLSRLRWAAHIGIFWGFLALVCSPRSTSACGCSSTWRSTAARPPGSCAATGASPSRPGGTSSAWCCSRGCCSGWRAGSSPRAAPADESRESDGPLLFFLLWLTLSGFLLEALRVAAGATRRPRPRCAPG